ncbi:MAG: HDOD domain-containing protein [Deltaproteobacteria bacterium]|nr:HDOD domain-containing protein [Deltaproteobacteria bacterium]
MRNVIEPRFSAADISLLVPQRKILQRLSVLLSQPQTKVDEVAVCCLQDPVLTLLILKKVGSSSELVTSTTEVKLLVLRLGFFELRKLVDELSQNYEELDPLIGFIYEKRVNHLIKVGVVSRILSEAVSKHLSEEVPAVGVLSKVVELLVMRKYQKDYLELYEQSTTQNFYLRFSKLFGNQIENLNVEFLKTLGVPSIVTKVLDLSEHVSNDELIIRNIVYGADELVQAFEADRLSRYAPGAILPSKSFLRLLPFTDHLYGRAFERVTVFLHKRVQVDQDLEVSVDLSKLDEEIGVLTSQRDDQVVKDASEDENTSQLNLTGKGPLSGILAELSQIKDFSTLCSTLLSKLTENELFDRSALIEVDFVNRLLKIVEEKGQGFSTKVVEIDSILINALNLTKVKSSKIPTSISLPFGSNTFAFMPLSYNDKLFLLYADTRERPIGLELRRSFREVADQVKQKLKELT